MRSGLHITKPENERPQSCNARLGKTQLPAALHAIDETPRSHIGKLLKTDLRALAGQLSPKE